MKRELTKNELDFLNEYLVNGHNAYQAYLKAYPKASKSTAKTNANTLMKRPLIIEYLKSNKTDTEIKFNVDRDYLIRECLSLIEDVKLSKGFKDRTAWNKAIDTLSKLTNSYAPIKLDVKNETTIKFDFDLGIEENKSE